MSTIPSPSKSNRTALFAVIGALGCLVLCVGIATIAGAAYILLNGTLAAQLAQGLPPTTQAPLSAPTTPGGSPAQAPKLESTGRLPANWETYKAVHAPFDVQYPADWSVSSEDEAQGTVVFMAPDLTAAASVIFIKAGTMPVDEALARINSQILSRNGTVNVISTNKNPDGSVTEELEYTNAALGGRVHSFARMARNADLYFLAIFDAQIEELERYAEIGPQFVASMTIAP